MSNQYLLESGSPDGYLLEDDSGVLLLDYNAGAQGNKAGVGAILARKPSPGLLAAGAYRNHPRYRGCVGHWLFREGGGLITFDSSGYKSDGTLTLGPTWQSGLFGPALNFDGTDDTVLAGNATQVQLTGSASVSAWARATSFNGADNHIFTKASDTLLSRAFKFAASVDNVSEQFYFSVSTDGTNNIRRYTTTTVVVATWYHIVGVYNAVAQTLDIYLNGKLDNGTLAGVVPASVFNSAEPITFGAIGARSDRNWAGLIDEARLYSRALYADEVASLYNDPFLEFRPPRRQQSYKTAAVTGPPAGSLALLGVGR